MAVALLACGRLNAAGLLLIDAGHGGSDLGVKAPDFQEAAAVLEIAKRLQSQLKAAGIESALTRSDASAGPTLSERATLANASGARAYLSLHINFSPSAQAKGARIFFPRGLSSAPAAATAGLLAWDKAASSRAAEARALAQQLALSLSAPDSGKASVQNLNLAPFRGLRLPAVLVELDFASNPASLARLKSEEFRKTLSQRLVQGIKAWAATLPPSGVAP